MTTGLGVVAKMDAAMEEVGKRFEVIAELAGQMEVSEDGKVNCLHCCQKIEFLRQPKFLFQPVLVADKLSVLAAYEERVAPVLNGEKR